MNTGARILIADDDPFLRELLTMTFADMACTLTVVTNGAEALERLYTDTYDLVLSDVRMPLMGGFTLLKEARSLVPRQRIIMMSSDDLDEDVLRDLGAYAFLQKPFSLETVRALAARALPAGILKPTVSNN